MHTPPDIIDAESQRDADVIAALNDAFATDPVLNWVLPRTAIYPDFFKLLIDKVYRPRGIVHMERQGRGAALWLPPGESFSDPMGMTMLLLVARTVLSHGFAFLGHLRSLQDEIGKYHPVEPHFYLQFVGCKTAHQGQGVGSALLKTGTRLADEAGMPAYLESSQKRNVELYERHGFEVMAHLHMPGGPEIWPMYRPAR